MSLAGEHLPLDLSQIDDGEAGIFSTISVPTSITHLEPASTGTTESGTLPLINGIIGDNAPDATSGVNSTNVVTSSTGVSKLVSSSGSITDEVLSLSTTQAVFTSSTASSKAGPSTIFTTIPISSTPDLGIPAPTAMIPKTENMINNSNILLPSSKLFPLGIVLVVLGALVISALATLILCKFRKRRRQRRLGDRILSFSPDLGTAPYPFDAKAYNDDIESRYPSVPRSVGLGDSPPRLAPLGIASSFPSQFETQVERRIENTVPGEYTRTTRAGVIHDRPDTFTCAMYPAGSCPLEHEVSTNPPIIIERGGSPVPSFHTARLDDQPIITSHQNHGRSLSGKLPTPPQAHSEPRYKSKHIPAPLMISPSISEGTNSVRGFTPRRSIVSVGSAYTAM